MTDRKEIRRLLWRWGRTLDYCAERQQEIDGFMELLRGIEEPAAIQPGPGRTGPGDPTGRLAVRVEELAARYRGEAQRMLEACDKELAFHRAMDEAIAVLPGDQRRVIELRYRQGCRWEYIALKMCFSSQHVRRLDAEAVDTLAGMIRVEILPARER